MEQQDAYKLLAAFMILIMIIVPVAYMVTSPREDTTKQKDEQNQQEKYNQEFWAINQPFDSISDALNMTPVGAESASYADLESMTPQMAQWVRQDLSLINEADSLYKSNTTKLYYANMQVGKNSSFLLLSTMDPKKNDFEYMVLPDTYPPILRRLEQGLDGLYNVMGTPVILAPGNTVVEVIDITSSLNKTNTSYDRFGALLAKVPPAPFQTISSNVSFAKQYYLGIRLNDGSYERTAAYLNANSGTLKNLTRLQANATQKGFTQYNITKSGNYTIVSIAGPDLLGVLSEGTS